MNSQLLRAMGAKGTIAVFVVDSTEVIRDMEKMQKTSPVASAALGRLTTGALLMACQMKHEKDSLTLQIQADGVIENMLAVANGQGAVKSFIKNPVIENMRKNGKLDVGGAVGQGELTVMKDFGLKKPYIGKTTLISGEIAEDLTNYYAKSEQIPTAIALGVLVDTDGSIINSGGFMLQLLPGATDETIDTLEALLKNLEPMTAMLSAGMGPKDIAKKLLAPFIIDGEMSETPVRYHCDCSREKMEGALISLGKEEINSIVEELGEAEMTCQFCNKTHVFSKNDLENILSKR